VTKRIACAFLLWALCAHPGIAAAEANGVAGDYRVIGGESELRILIFSAGALGGLGHNHVISSKALDGSVQVGEAPADSAFELSLPVQELVVDAPEARAAAGAAFEGEVDDESRRGTRENMLGGKLLEAGRYPEVRIVSESISGEFPRMTVQARIEIKGSPHAVELPVSVAFRGDRLIAVGRTQISHAELGLEPFSAGFGTLRVAENMIFRYRIVAEQVRP
jgi:polyisoprenoid-binding protein YceI